MSFPFEFAKSRGDYDFFSPVINFTANATVLAVGGISLGAISYLSLKALGFNKITTTIATAVPVALGSIGVAGSIVGGCIATAMVIGIVKAFGRR